MLNIQCTVEASHEACTVLVLCLKTYTCDLFYYNVLRSQCTIAMFKDGSWYMGHGRVLKLSITCINTNWH